MYKYREFLEMQKKERELYEEKLDRLYPKKAASSAEGEGNYFDESARPDSLDEYIPANNESKLNSIKMPSFLNRK